MPRPRNLLRKIDLFHFQELRVLDWFLLAVLVGLALEWRLCYYLWKGIWLDEGFSILIFHDAKPYTSISAAPSLLFLRSFSTL